MNAPTATKTMEAFGYPETLIADYEWWCVLLRPKQPTLASLILAAKSQTTAFSGLPPAAFSEMAIVVADIEKALKAFRPYDKINYLMLMMKDPEPHFHVIPRYSAEQKFEDGSYEDPGWPGPPKLDVSHPISHDASAKLIVSLQQCWPTLKTTE
ncbi:MAG: HIT family protein [Pseudomonadota bacterium]